MIDQETHRTIDTEIIPALETEATQIIEINDILIIHEIIQITDQIIKDLIITIIKTDHEKIHKIVIQTITIDKETTLNHLIEITRYPDSQNNYRSNTPKHQRQINQYKQLKKEIQTP